MGFELAHPPGSSSFDDAHAEMPGFTISEICPGDVAVQLKSGTGDGHFFVPAGSQGYAFADGPNRRHRLHRG
jgi:hypothetical protein